MKVFSDTLFNDFRTRLLRALATRHPVEAAALGDTLPTRLGAALAEAEARGFTAQEHLATYVECSLVFGPPPWSAPLGDALARDDLPADFAAACFTEAARAVLARRA